MSELEDFAMAMFDSGPDAFEGIPAFRPPDRTGTKQDQIDRLTDERREELRQHLITVMERGLTVSAKADAGRLGATPSQLNSVLYGNKRIFQLDEESRVWRLREDVDPDAARKPVVEKKGLTEILLAVLRAAPGATSEELAHELDLEIEDVEEGLEAFPELFDPLGNFEVRWYVRNDLKADSAWSEIEIDQSWLDEGVMTPGADAKRRSPLRRTEFRKRPPSGTKQRPPILDAVPLAEYSPVPPMYRWQAEALEAWQAASHRGIVDAVTASGKTRIGLEAVREVIADGGRALVIVPSIVLLRQWAGLLGRSLPEVSVGLAGDGLDSDLSNHDVVVATLGTASRRDYSLDESVPNLLVADECHRVAAPKLRVALDSRFSRRLGLSATHERADGAHEEVLIPYFGEVIYEMSYRQAIDQGVVAQVRVAFVPVVLDEESRERYDELKESLKVQRRRLVTRFGCRPVPFPLFLSDVVRLIGTGSSEAKKAAMVWMAFWNEKRALLAESPAKLSALAQLSGAIGDAGRTLVYTQSIESAGGACQVLRALGHEAAVHHSGLSAEERRRVLEDFETGSVDVIVTVQTLEEGVDVPEADLAVVIAATKQRRQMIQRMGRVLRLKGDGRDARFVILFLEGTDEDPREGAHETFVTELVDVARSSMVFEDLIAEEDAVRVFLKP